MCSVWDLFFLSRLSSLMSFTPLSPPLSSGLEVCDPPDRLMVVMIGGFFGVGAELLLPGIAALCRDWQILQAVATLPLILLLSYWW